MTPALWFIFGMAIGVWLVSMLTWRSDRQIARAQALREHNERLQRERRAELGDDLPDCIHLRDWRRDG